MHITVSGVREEGTSEPLGIALDFAARVECGSSV